MDKALKLYNSKGAFPSVDDQIEVFGFNYDAKRMGGAPIITATVIYGLCLDAVWADDVYVELNGEKYYLKQTPTSSFSNTDARYKHECEFVSERIKLDNVYFFDTVVGDPQGYDKPVSNSSVFSFFGNIREFAKRLNASLQYSKLQTKNNDGTYSGYVVIVNNDVDEEEKLLSFSNVPFSTALQESYNQFKIPYYFVGKEIHFGYWENAIEEPFRYGVDKELLSITKTNANQKVITRCTGIGGTENIPYYYPNTHPQGELIPLYNNKKGVVNVVDDALFSKNVLLTDVITNSAVVNTTVLGKSVEIYQYSNFYKYKNSVSNKGFINGGAINDSNWFLAPKKNWTDSQKENYATSALGDYSGLNSIGEYINVNNDNKAFAIRVSFDSKYFIPSPTTDAEVAKKTFVFTIKNLPDRLFNNSIKFLIRAGNSGLDVNETNFKIEKISGESTWQGTFAIHESWFNDILNYDKAIYIVFELRAELREGKTFKPVVEVAFQQPETIWAWRKKNGEITSLAELGLSHYTPAINDTITFEQISYVQPMPTLMPPVYWESEGEERFYNALNDTYYNPDTDSDYVFYNPYSDSKRVEHIVEFPDIKPSIEGMTNNAGQPINAFLEFAYDEEDNDAVDQNGNYIHPYFYAKLPKFDSFNLFTHANEKGEVTFSMKSGNCGACNFVLGVNAESGKNDLQVDDDGKLLFENGIAKRGAPQDRQNNTKDNEVWVALKKDNSTFGTIMPSAQHRYYPAAGDTFVLLNITMPVKYIKAAENRLKEEIIKYMYENNVEKFSFSIKFSRIYLAENPLILNTLNENAFIKVEYNGVEHPSYLYVNSFAYKMTAGEALPEITIELAETLSASMNAIQAAVSQVRTDVLDRVQKMDIAAMVAANFLSKNSEDYAKQKITFNRGISVGTQDAEVANIDQMGHAEIESATLKQYISSPTFRDGFSGEGFKMWLDDNGLSYLTIDVLTARQRMVIYEMLISKARSVNGGLWVSAANGTIAKTIEHDDEYEVILEDTNSFVAGDYMRCQVFSALELRAYWVEINRVDGDRLFISKEEFENHIPQDGDDVFLCGSKNVNRQNAIHISATEDGQPRISIYNGIQTKDFSGCLRTQLGNLDNIKDEFFGDNQPHGDGLYSDNAFLKGDFILRNSGKNVETQFAITEEGIKSAVGSMQDDMEHGGTILYNPSFTMGENGWITSNVVIYYLLGNSPIFNGNSLVLNNAHENADADYNHRFILNINDGYIKQLNEYFVNKPEFSDTTFVPLMFGLKIMVEEDGNLLIYMDGCNADANKVKAFKGKARVSVGIDESAYILLGNGKLLTFGNAGDNNNVDDELLVVIKDGEYELYNATRKTKIYYSFVSEVSSLGAYDTLDEPVFFIGYKELVAKEEYLTLEFTSEWNGTGNFNLAFTGGASIYSLQLSTDMVEVRHATLFEQTERLLKLTAGIYDKDQQALKESGIVIKPEGVGIYTQDANGNIATIGTYEEGVVKLTGNEIILEGNVTANGNVTIDKDGKLAAKDGTFEGKITAKEGDIGDFEITTKGLKYIIGNYTAELTPDAFTIGDSGSYGDMTTDSKHFSVNGHSESDLTAMRLNRYQVVARNSDNSGFSPVLEVNENSSFPSVALKTKGSIICNGGLINSACFLTLATNSSESNILTPLKSTIWIVKNDLQNYASVFIPKLSKVKAYLGVTDTDCFAIPFRVLCARNTTYGIQISFQDGESELNFVDYDGGGNYNTAINAGDNLEFLLIFDGENYYAQITNRSV